MRNWILAGTGFWFLQALFIGKSIIFVLRKNHIDGINLLFVTFTLLVVAVLLNTYGEGVNLFYYRHSMIASFWISVGLCLKSNQNLFHKSMKWCLMIYPFIALMSLKYAPSFTAGINMSIKSVPIHLVYSFIGTMFLLAICRKVDSNGFLQYWGKNSLVVYGLHFPPLLYLTALLWNNLWPRTLLEFICFLSVLYIIELSVCWLIMKLFERRPLSILIGKF